MRALVMISPRESRSSAPKERRRPSSRSLGDLALQVLDLHPKGVNHRRDHLVPLGRMAGRREPLQQLRH